MANGNDVEEGQRARSEPFVFGAPGSDLLRDLIGRPARGTKPRFHGQAFETARIQRDTGSGGTRRKSKALENVMLAAFILCVGLLLAFANGANDNFKGVSTIYGSRVASYRAALFWATLTTLVGSIVSVLAMKGLVVTFSGQGLVGSEVAARGRFPAVTALSAGLTVLIASRIGMPISTTHALVGALAGVAFAGSVGWGWFLPLAYIFFLPLVTSPLVSLALSWMANRVAVASAPRCICVASAETASCGGTVLVPVVGTESECAAHGAKPLLKASWFLNGLHFLSAGAVGFMRGMNDTPKLLGVLAAGGLFVADLSLAIMVGLAMSLGGLVGSRRIARTMGEQLTPMSPAQGTISNALTSAIVGAASAWSLPVSTTHVSCGAIFGLGAARKELSKKWAGAVVGSWLFTLPVACVLASVLWFGLSFLD